MYIINIVIMQGSKRPAADSKSIYFSRSSKQLTIFCGVVINSCCVQFPPLFYCSSSVIRYVNGYYCIELLEIYFDEY